ncbi:MAG: hypothetical protein ACLU0O_03695 [Collinsella sp.]
MAAQVKNDLDALGFDVTIQTDTSPATYAAIDGGEAYDILLAPGDPSCFGADPDLLLNWWYGDNVWMQTRCPWKDSAEWAKLHGLMDEALPPRATSSRRSGTSASTSSPTTPFCTPLSTSRPSPLPGTIRPLRPTARLSMASRASARRACPSGASRPSRPKTRLSHSGASVVRQRPHS